MPSFLDTVFGRKKPTSTAAATELAARKAELAAIPSRIAEVEVKLKRVADMSDAEHKAAVEELGALQRARVRVGAQVEDLEKALDATKKAEAATKLRAQAEAADRAIREEYPQALAEYETACKVMAEKAARLDDLDGAVEAVNCSIRAARKDARGVEHPDFVKSSTERYRSEPDIVEPDHEVVEPKWCREGQPKGGALVTVLRGGRQVPTDGDVWDLEERPITRIIAGRTRKGRMLGAPQASLVLPATRLGASAYWPRRP